jgi:cell division septum initiation protein DivIVA
MLRENEPSPQRGFLDRDEPGYGGYDSVGYTGPANASGGYGGDRSSSVDIQREPDRLAELINDSVGIPLMRWRFVDEDLLLDQLALVQLNLPEAFEIARAITRHKDELLMEAEQYARDLIEDAERQAAQILNETTILRQAELEAQQIRTRLQQECDMAKEQTLNDIDAMRLQAKQELEDLHYRTVIECEEMQIGADSYAAGVLDDMEHRLAEMLRVVRNGRNQLGPEPEIPQRSGGRGLSGGPNQKLEPS